MMNEIFENVTKTRQGIATRIPDFDATDVLITSYSELQSVTEDRLRIPLAFTK